MASVRGLVFLFQGAGFGGVRNSIVSGERGAPAPSRGFGMLTFILH